LSVASDQNDMPDCMKRNDKSMQKTTEH
jgi:hypothetical protein